MMDDGLSAEADGGGGAAAATAPEGGLPEGWTYGGVSDEGNHYYHCSGGTTWSTPVVLPEGWEQKLDASSGYC
jgi:hypothetical protein